MKSAIYCDHANEIPTGQCPCDADCYCRNHTCRDQIAIGDRIYTIPPGNTGVRRREFVLAAQQHAADEERRSFMTKTDSTHRRLIGTEQDRNRELKKWREVWEDCGLKSSNSEYDPDASR